MTFAFFLKTERVEKNNRIIAALFLAYIVLGSLIVVLDLGNTLWGQWIAKVGRSLIPAIKGTAEITSAPDSAATVLAIAWIWGGIMHAPVAWLLLTTRCHVVNWEHWNKLTWVMKNGFLVGVLAGIFVAAHLVPTDSAGMEWIIFNLLNASPIYIVLWGMAIWASIWIGLLVTTISLIGLIGQFNKGDKL